MKLQTKQVDVAIVGAGPVGMHVAFQAGLMGLSSCLTDVLDFIGGQCSALYPEKPIYDIPACPSILAGDLIKNLELQTKIFAPELRLGHQITGISKTADGFVLQAVQKNSKDIHEIKARAVVIAAGSGAFTPNKPPISEIEQYENKLVFYSVQNKDFFNNKDIVICGGGDSAVDWAIILAEIARSVTLVHRRKEFGCMPDNLHKLQLLNKHGKVRIKAPYQLADIKTHGNNLVCISINGPDGLSNSMWADAVLLFFGLTMNLGNMHNWGLRMDKKHIAVNPENMSTSVEGIYAAGDIVTYPGKLKLILTGFAEAALACRSIHSYLNPNKSGQHFAHSTSRSELFTQDKTGDTK